jgi:hypothetical protein
MAVILDPELKALIAQEASGAVLWQDAEAGQTALLAKAADKDVVSFQGPVPIQTQWELGRYAGGSVLRLLLVIFDQPEQPYRFETFINVGAPEQLACVTQLLAQQTLSLHFFDSQTAYVFTKAIRNPRQQRWQLRALVNQAVQDWQALGERWDFDQAKALFQAHRPLS